MSAGRLDIKAKQGGRFRRTLTYGTKTDPTDPNEDLVPTDITGYTFQMQVRDGFGVGAPLVLELSTGNGRIVTVDAANGIFRLQVNASVMAALTPGKYKYDLEMVNSGDAEDVEPLMEGCFRVAPEVTV